MTTQITPPVLKDTTLCAIVRDEMMNPAQLPGKSGIRSFVESHVPFVEQAVIVDTGSVDGTRQELEQLQAEFPNLEVRDHKFDGYVHSRNASIAGVKTRYILVLDVDEVLETGEIQRLSENLSNLDLDEEKKLAISFELRQVSYSGRTNFRSGNSDRFFLNSKRLKFDSEWSRGIWEFLFFVSRDGIPRRLHSGQTTSVSPDLVLYHFAPGNQEALGLKESYWYAEGYTNGLSPAKSKHFEKWKAQNTHRTDFT